MTRAHSIRFDPRRHIAVALNALLLAACSSSPSGSGGELDTTAIGSAGTSSGAADVGNSNMSVNGAPVVGAPTGSTVATTTGVLTPGVTASGGATSAPQFASNADAVSLEDSAAAGGASAEVEEPGSADAGTDTADPTVPATPPVVNPFVKVAHDPLSTFAADVDTASYDLFRQYLGSGVLPPAQLVRTEEFVNYFSYAYEPPAEDAEHPFSISLAAAPNLVDRSTTLLRVGIQGKEPVLQEKRPANLVFLVDTSGSMSEELPLVTDLLTRTLGILDPTDTVAIVTYAGSTEVKLTPTPVSDADVITATLTNLASSGGTAGSAGLDLAYQQAEAAFLEGGINHVILCTDGDFNVGPSSTEELLLQITDARKGGVTLTALGFGTQGVNDAMLEQVSNAGNGIYGVITDGSQAQRYVDERLLQNLTYIAKDVKLQVEFNPEHVDAYRLLGYEDRAIADQDFRNDVIDAGEIGSGHRVTAIYELVLAGDSVPEVEGAPAIQSGDGFDGEREVAPEALVLVKVRYKDVDATEEDAAHETSAELAPEDVAETAPDLDADFRWAVAIATYSEILRGSPYLLGDELAQVEALVRPLSDIDADRAEFVALFDQSKPLIEALPE